MIDLWRTGRLDGELGLTCKSLMQVAAALTRCLLVTVVGKFSALGVLIALSIPGTASIRRRCSPVFRFSSFPVFGHQTGVFRRWIFYSPGGLLTHLEFFFFFPFLFFFFFFFLPLIDLSYDRSAHTLWGLGSACTAVDACLDLC